MPGPVFDMVLVLENDFAAVGSDFTDHASRAYLFRKQPLPLVPPEYRWRQSRPPDEEPDRPLFRRGAAYVAKILRGAKASDLPVEQASNFEFTLNLKTAKATGFTLPTSILLRANEVIE